MLSSTLVKVNELVQKRWNDWDPLCYPACDKCWKNDGYRLRSSWLTEWMTCFIRNEEDISKGTKRMPRLNWGTNSEANRILCNLEEYHKKQCLKDKLYSDCDCSCSLIMREIWGNTTLDAYGVIEILGRYKNLRKHFIC